MQGIAEMLRLNVPIAMKLSFDGLKDSAYKTRDAAITDLAGFDSVELSVLLCNDEFIRKLNKEWRDEDHPTDVLSMSQHVPGLKLPIVRMYFNVAGALHCCFIINKKKLLCYVVDGIHYLQLMLGDIVISVETAARQAEERGHSLLDEIRILLVGLILY